MPFRFGNIISKKDCEKLLTNFKAPQDPQEWIFNIRQYASQLFIYYMNTIKKVDIDYFIAHEMGDYENPQTYWFYNLGAEKFRSIFLDWAAEISADYSFLTRSQYRNALDHITVYSDWKYVTPHVWNSTDEGTNGEWVRPPQNMTARGWAWNVFNITNTKSQQYT